MQWSCRSIFTGNLHRISSTSSDGRVGSDGVDKVLVEVVDCYLLVAVGSSVSGKEGRNDVVPIVSLAVWRHPTTIKTKLQIYCSLL